MRSEAEDDGDDLGFMNQVSIEPLDAQKEATGPESKFEKKDVETFS